MEQPKGFDDGSGRVGRLLKLLYGLKQAGRLGTKVDAVMPPVPEINQDFYSDQSYNESELGGLVIYTRLEVGSQFQEIFS